MSLTLSAFVADFMKPLLGGGAVRVGAPISARDRERMLADPMPLADRELLELRQRRGMLLVSDPDLPEPAADELALWLALHNILALDHPQAERVWTRAATWRQVESQTRAFVADARPPDVSEATTRHVAVEAFLEVRRRDHVIRSGETELRFLGQEPPPRRMGLFSTPGEARTQVVRWVEQEHRPAAERLLGDLLWITPLTTMLHPELAPQGWSPLLAAPFLRRRAFARAICHRWALEEAWWRIGAVVCGSLLVSLGIGGEVVGGSAEAESRGSEKSQGAMRALPGQSFEDGPVAVGDVVGALIHLHILKVLEFDARVGVGGGPRDWAVLSFLALPLLLPQLRPALGDPLLGAEHDFVRRWEEYTEHLRGMVPRSVVENLLAALVGRIVERSNA